MPVTKKKPPKVRFGDTINEQPFPVADAERKNSKIPWQTLRREVVYGYVNDAGERVYPSVRQVAERYGCNLGLVVKTSKYGNSSVQGDWLKDRTRAQAEIDEETKRRAVEFYGAELAKMEQRHLRGHQAAEAAIMVSLYETDDEGRFITPMRFRSGLTPSDIRTAYSVYCAATDRQRILMGLPTERIEVADNSRAPEVLAQLTPDDLALAGRQLALAMSTRGKGALVLRDGSEVLP